MGKPHAANTPVGASGGQPGGRLGLAVVAHHGAGALILDAGYCGATDQSRSSRR